jgi:hypothetical protein
MRALTSSEENVNSISCLRLHFVFRIAAPPPVPVPTAEGEGNIWLGLKNSGLLDSRRVPKV